MTDDLEVRRLRPHLEPPFGVQARREEADGLVHRGHFADVVQLGLVVVGVEQSPKALEVARVAEVVVSVDCANRNLMELLLARGE